MRNYRVQQLRKIYNNCIKLRSRVRYSLCIEYLYNRKILEIAQQIFERNLYKHITGKELE